MVDLLVRLHTALLGYGGLVQVEGEAPEPMPVSDPAGSQVDVRPLGRSAGCPRAEQDHLLQIRVASEHGDQFAQRGARQFDLSHDSSVSCSAISRLSRPCNSSNRSR